MTTRYEWEQENATDNEFDIAEEMVASSGAVAVVFGNEVQNLTKAAAKTEKTFSEQFQAVYERPALATTTAKAAKPTV